jgi:hypothetical protein
MIPTESKAMLSMSTGEGMANLCRMGMEFPRRHVVS